MTNSVRLLFALAIASLPSFAATLRAGVAKVDITPAGKEVLWGYESRLAPATSTLDPLYARVLVLEVGDKRLALVTLDLGSQELPVSTKAEPITPRLTCRPGLPNSLSSRRNGPCCIPGNLSRDVLPTPKPASKNWYRHRLSHSHLRVCGERCQSSIGR